MYVNFFDNKTDEEIGLSQINDGCSFIEGRILYFSLTNVTPEIYRTKDIPLTTYKIMRVEYHVRQTVGGYLSSGNDIDTYVYLEKTKEDEI